MFVYTHTLAAHILLILNWMSNYLWPDMSISRSDNEVIYKEPYYISYTFGLSACKWRYSTSFNEWIISRTGRQP